MSYQVLITKHGESRPFWTKTVPTWEDAKRVRRKNQRLIDREGWQHSIEIEEIEETP